MGKIEFKWIHIFNFMLAVIVAIFIGVVMIAVNTFTGNPAYGKTDSTITLINDNWKQVKRDGSTVEFNKFGESSALRDLTISRVFVFDQFEQANSLSFKTNYCAVEVYQDGNLIYSFGSIDDVKKGILPGINVCIVPIDVYFGEASEIVIHLVSNLDIIVNDIYFGSTIDNVSDKFDDSIGTIIFSVSMTVIAIVIGTFALTGRKRLKMPSEFFYLLLFVILIAIWAISDIQVLSAIGIPAGVVSIISYESFAIMLLPFMAYMYYDSEHLKKLDLIAVILLFINFLIINILHFSRVLNFAQLVGSSQILIFFCIFIVVIQTIIDCFKNRTISTVLIVTSLVVVLFGAIVRLIVFYSRNENKSSVVLQVGLAIFVIIQVGKLFTEIFNLIDEGRRAEDYLSLARTDSLTGLGNRRDLDVYISKIVKSPTPVYRLGCIVCDLNDLKITNDVYGHSVGDDLIKNFADCLQVCFENRGKVFRTGGDEFYILFSDVEVDMSAMMRRLTICLDGTNSNSEHKISCSCGCYADYVPANNEDAVWDIIKFADAEMYKMKKADRAKRKAQMEEKE